MRWLIIAILLLAALGLGWWVWSNQALAPAPIDNQPPISSATTSVDTSNWQTYRDEEYGFEFKYPSVWRVIDQRADSVVIVNYSREEERPVGGLSSDMAKIGFSILDVREGDILDYLNILEEQLRQDWIAYMKTESLSRVAKRFVYRTTDLMISGFSVKQVTYFHVGEGGGYTTIARIPQLSRTSPIYQFWLLSGDDIQKHDNFVKTFDQILSTFRFIE